jgi:hypothetical protein
MVWCLIKHRENFTSYHRLAPGEHEHPAPKIGAPRQKIAIFLETADE